MQREEPFWKRGLDFNHGTGHGVGISVNVHERPIGIRYRVVPERQENTPFMPAWYVPMSRESILKAAMASVRESDLLQER